MNKQSAINVYTFNKCWIEVSALISLRATRGWQKNWHCKVVDFFTAYNNVGNKRAVQTSEPSTPKIHQKVQILILNILTTTI